MIKLKSGNKIEYHNEFDVFFQNLLEAIIKDSQTRANDQYISEKSKSTYNDLFLKEIMDNCIYVTHQLFDIAKTNEELSKFMVTGFIFNSIVISLVQMQDGDTDDSGDKGDDEEIIH